MISKTDPVTRKNSMVNLMLPLFAVAFLIFIGCGRNNDSNFIEPPAPPPPPPPPSEMLDESGVEPFNEVDKMPVFQGGDSALIKYIADHTIYPETAKKDTIQGKVIVRFCVTEKGTINRVSVLNGVSPELDAESIRVIKSLPDFVPGEKDGKAVPVWFMIPITFVLK